MVVCVQSGNSQSEVWGLLGPAGDVWQKGQVTVISKDLFFILIEGVRGISPNGHIAIDTLVLTKGPCKLSGKTLQKSMFKSSAFSYTQWQIVTRYISLAKHRILCVLKNLYGLEPDECSFDDWEIKYC